MVGVFLQPGANALEVASTVKRTADQLAKRFPEGLAHFDSVRHDAIRRSVDLEVVLTLSIAVVLVFLVVYLFLQNWRATLIPVIAVPVSLIGTFAGLLMLGYSINTLTLFGMVLAIGIVVDDAIVARKRRADHARGEAQRARSGHHRDGRGDEPDHRDRAGADFGVCSDRLPRRVDRRAVSSVCDHDLDRSRDLGHRRVDADAGLVRDDFEARDKNPGRFTAFNNWFANVTRRYTSGVIWMIRRGAPALALFGIMVVVAATLWRLPPSSWCPTKTRVTSSWLILPDGSSLQRTDKVVDEVARIMKENPVNQDVVAFTGLDFPRRRLSQ